jgi:hypothetical protein
MKILLKSRFFQLFSVDGFTVNLEEVEHRLAPREGTAETWGLGPA